MSGEPEKTLTIETWPMSPIPYDNDEIYKSYPIAKLPKNLEVLPVVFKRSNPGMTKEELNSFGFRCDEFIKSHEGMHILFSGCSYTFGTGLLLEEVWSKIVYNKINNEIKCSGYFNLGFPGSGVLSQVPDIFKYCDTYGKPDVIFFNITDLRRFFGLKLDQETGLPLSPPVMGNAFIKNEIETLPIFQYIGYQYYYMLDQYCKTNKIKLISFSWRDKHFFNKFVDNNESSIKNFYKYSIEEMKNFTTEYKIKNPDKKFILTARDGQHHGIAYHEFWADFIYKKYKEFYV